MDCSLKFHLHIRSIANKAGGVANNLLKSTINRDSYMLTLHCTHIRPIIESSCVIWNTGYLGDIQLLEGVQRRWTKEISGFAHLNYGTRLRNLKLYSVHGRLLRADLIKVWKIFYGMSPIRPSDLFLLHTSSSTRGHPFKIFIPHTNYDIRKRFFSVRVLNVWNRLPGSVVLSQSLQAFKKNLALFLGAELYEYSE